MGTSPCAREPDSRALAHHVSRWLLAALRRIVIERLCRHSLRGPLAGAPDQGTTWVNPQVTEWSGTHADYDSIDALTVEYVR